MKSIFTIFVMFMILSLPVLAQEHEQKFNARCTQSGKTASFCSCALEALSNDMRKQNTRKLAENKMHLKNSTEALLADPVMTQDKIDAIHSVRLIPNLSFLSNNNVKTYLFSYICFSFF